MEVAERELSANQFGLLVEEANRFLGTTDIFVQGDQKLLRMEEMMRAVGDPQNSIKVVHVAGTSGKTSTVYFAAEFLRTAGYMVGMTVSPHMVDVRERAQTGGGRFGGKIQLLDKGEFAEYLADFLKLVQATGIRPSYYEFYMGFFYWLAAKLELDFAVVETGMGGLYDASNVTNREDKICIITDIGFDHEEILGRSLPLIAEQKAGIIHVGNSVFMNEQAPEVMEVVEARCKAVGAKLTVLNTEKGTDFQKRNLDLARAAVGGEGEVNMQVPARAEEFMWHGKRVIIDGAHNPQKLRAFVDYAKGRYKNATLVVSFGENKREALAENMRILRELSDSIILAEFHDDSVLSHLRKSASLEAMRSAAETAGFSKIETGGGVEQALGVAEECGARSLVVVGSFFLASDARKLLAKSESVL